MGVKLAYGLGSMGFVAKDAAFVNFVPFFYTQVVGLSGTLYGAAALIGQIADAITDPPVGTLSDSHRSRWGRRHPFMAFSILPLALCFLMLFHQLHADDEALARMLGIREAEQADQVFVPSLDAAQALIAELEPRLGRAPATAFGVRGATALLHDAYRLCIHHGLLRGIRKALSLPAPCEVLAGEKD